MQNLKTQLAVVFLATLCLLTGAFAQFTPSQDSYTFNHQHVGLNYGTAPTIRLESSEFGQSIANSYIQFDLSSIPSSYTGANVTKASLKLFVNSIAQPGGSFNVDLVNGSWTEDGITYNNAPALGTTITNGIALTTANVNHYVIVDVTSAVQAWLDGTQSNDGIALVANIGLGVFFDSKENTTTSHPPELDIVFAGGGGAITGITTAGGSGLMGGGSTGNLNLSLTNACSIGQVLAWNGAGGGWVCSTVTGGGGGITGTGTVNSLPLFATPTSVASSNVFQSGLNIGIGTTTPQATLDVNGNINLPNTLSSTAGVLSLGGTPFLNNYGTADTFVGAAAGNVNSTNTGSYNSAFGFAALFENTTGSYNAANGHGALFNNTAGNNNTASGNGSLLNNTTGVENTAVGSAALNNNSTGSYNTALGFFAGSDATTPNLNNATAIGAYADVTVSNALVLGAINGTNGCAPPNCDTTKVGIGTTAPAFPLDVNGVIRSSTGGFMFPDGSVQTKAASGGVGNGTVTSVGSGLGLTGGPITNSGTLTIDTSVVPLLATSNTFGGAITALSFTGNGAGLTSVNAAALGGFSPSTFATIGPNTFTGNQTITGSLFASGNVGIGTTTPLATLDVNGSINLPNTTSSTVGVLSLGGVPFLSNYPGKSSLNTFVGASAGNTNSTLTGTANSAVGSAALNTNTTGFKNNAFGTGALNSNTTGNENNAFGNLTLNGNSMGSHNSAFGSNVLGAGGGSSNSAFGFNALASLISGNSNIAVGSNAGNALVAGESNNIDIGNFGVAGESNIIRIGDPTVQTAAYIAGNLNVSGTVTCASGCGGGGGGGSGTVTSVATGLGLTGGPVTTSGTVSINTAVVPQLGVANIFTGANQFTGSTTAAAITATSLTANTGGSGPGNIYGNNLYLYTANGPIYPFAFASGSSVDDSVFLGFAGENINQSCPADFNTAIGWRALNVNGPGCGFQAIFNTAVGAQALTSNTLGLDNTATGYTALYQNITGNYNAANGDEALYYNTAGNNNTASGHSSLLNTTGSFNTGSGSNALQYNTTGGNNTALGALAGPDSASTGLNYSTAIGAGAVVSASNALVLGGPQASAAAVNVGIGTAAPLSPLDVRGNASITGNLTVTGTLSKGAGTFKIDHPLDPANKYLYHSFVESPDMMNVYNGNISTDGSGLATVTLPDWFEALNRDFRYQLTVIGQFAQAIVASEVSHNQFTIRTDRPNVKVSWQVTGIRQDAYANAHRIQVEEDKPAQDQGHYLHPELFGAGPEQAVGYHAPAVAPQR
ncbi:MAG TPA: DNRLRE domain-containing protein [Candidatus Sulfotelmatobacter sp.]|jgi:hypothetical protein